MQQESIFTKIIKGEIPTYKIYEDDRVIAILTDRPLFEGHTLVIPKVQVDHLWDLEDDDYHYLLEISKKIAKKIRSVYNSPRVGMVVEGFGVPHAHIHLIPIYESNDLEKHPSLELTPEQFEAAAIKLKM